MRDGDNQVGKPERIYADIRVNIEALPNPQAGWVAYATDTGLTGYYDGLAWRWGSAFSGLDYYPDDVASGVLTYEVLKKTPPSQPEEDDSASVTSGSEVLIEAYITDAGDPGVTVIPSGMWLFHGYAYRENIGAGNSTLKAYIYKVDSAGGTPVLIATIESDPITATLLANPQEFTKEYYTSLPLTVLQTDRILIEIYGKTTATTRTIHFLHSGTTHASHFTTPLVGGGGGGGSGNVIAPLVAPAPGNVAVYGADQYHIADGGAPSGTGDVHGDPAATTDHIAVFGVDGYHIVDGGVKGGVGEKVFNYQNFR